MKVLLNNHTSGELGKLLAPYGVTPQLARRLLSTALRQGRFPAIGPGAPKAVLTALPGMCEIPSLRTVARAESPIDGFVKYLFEAPDGARIEAVRIPLMHRAGDEKYVVCVSSQVGCAMGCQFCATGRLGWTRDLAPWEMVDQVRAIRDDASYPVRGVVFMGMGEPLMNVSAVLAAAAIMSEPCGLAIAAKAITISTVGIVPGIRKITERAAPYRLVVSLTSADPVVRARLLPVAVRYPLPELMDALRAYHAATRQRVTLAWTMMAGINTREKDAIELAELTRGLPIKLDLIDVNDPSGAFAPPDDKELARFRDALRKHLRAPVARRYSGGRDIHAACGMLALTQ